MVDFLFGGDRVVIVAPCDELWAGTQRGGCHAVVVWDCHAVVDLGVAVEVSAVLA